MSMDLPSYPAGSERYAAFREQVFPLPPSPQIAERKAAGGGAAPSGEVAANELELQARWFSGEFGRHFSTTDGQAVEIVQFGHWNRGAGPDFTETAIKAGGKLLTGAIEIDLDAAGWEEHGHSVNPAFDGVVLHLYLQSTRDGIRYARTSENRQVLEVELGASPADHRPAWWGHLPEARLGRCATPLREFSEDRLESLLSSAAQYRLRRKAARFQTLSLAHSASQALFQGCAEALGYRHNKLPMAALAQRLPIGEVLSRHSPGEVEALCFGVSGFLGTAHYEHSAAETRDYLRELWDHWWKLRDAHELAEQRRPAWHAGAVRPANHPQRRIAALALLASRWRELLGPLLTKQELPDTWPITFQKQCGALAHPFWSRHCTLKSDPSPKAMALIGADRVRDLLGNVLFPQLIHEGAATWDGYTALPGAVESESLRRARLRLFGPELSGRQVRGLSSRYYRQQALLQIFQDFCLADFSECSDCPFPEQLRQW